MKISALCDWLAVFWGAPFLGSFLILQVIDSFAFRWIDRKYPDPTIPKWLRWRLPAIVDVLCLFLGLHLLIDVWQESRMAAAVGMTGALTLMFPSFFRQYLEWRARRRGQTTYSIPSAVTK